MDKYKVFHQTTHSVHFSWIPNDLCDVYEVEQFIKSDEWKTVYWGRTPECNIYNLKENWCHIFRVNCLQQINNEFVKFHVMEPLRVFTLADITMPTLYRAIRNGKETLIQQYLTMKPSLIDGTGSDGMTSLGWASRLGKTPIVMILLKAGANKNRGCTILNRTPLQLAVIYEHFKVTKILLDHNVDLLATDKSGSSVTHYAIDSQNMEIIELLINSGIDLEQRDSHGWTLLLRAVAMHCKLEIIKILCDAGSSITAVDHDNRSAVFIATVTNQMIIKNYLEQFNANETFSIRNEVTVP